MESHALRLEAEALPEDLRLPGAQVEDALVNSVTLGLLVVLAADAPEDYAGQAVALMAAGDRDLLHVQVLLDPDHLPGPGAAHSVGLPEELLQVGQDEQLTVLCQCNWRTIRQDGDLLALEVRLWLGNEFLVLVVEVHQVGALGPQSLSAGDPDRTIHPDGDA